jgi:hypothetical protein
MIRLDRTTPVLLALILTLTLGTAAQAQTVRVHSGATVEVSNGSVLGLEGGEMDLGAAGSAARLSETSAGRVAGGTLTATRALNNPSSADPAGLGAQVSAGVDLGEVTVTRGHAAQTGSGNQGIARYYDISPSKNNSGLSAELAHTYHDAELGGLAESDLELFKSTDGGSTWTEEGAGGRSTGPTGGNTVTLSGIESFSRWTFGSRASPLPVELASFEGTTTEGGVRPQWRTASETESAGFEVQRRTGEGPSFGTWTQVGFVESKAEGGTSSEVRAYRFTDAEVPYAADSLRYRLRQVDTDGSAAVTDPVTVGRSGPEQLELLGTYPNPARSRAVVRYGVPEAIAREGGAREGEVTLRLYDVLGREVRTVRAGGAAAEAGRHETRLDVSGLASGVYLLRLSAGDAPVPATTRRLTVAR